MPTLTPDAVLRAAALVLDTHPELWGRDFWLDPASGCRCSGGLIAYVIAPDDGDGDPYRLPDIDQRELAEATIRLFEAHVTDELLDRFSPDGLDIGEPLIGVWNDRCARDAAHVAATMRAAADAAQAARFDGDAASEWVAQNYSDESKRLVTEGAEATPEDQAKYGEAYLAGLFNRPSAVSR